MVDQAAARPCVGFWPRVGKAAVVLHAVANRTIDLYSIASFAAPRIEIPIDGDHPGPAFWATRRSPKDRAPRVGLDCFAPGRSCT